jgi:D-lactate dehydrogenase
MSSSIWPQLISFVSVQRSQILRDLVSIQARQARKCLSSGRLRSLDIVAGAGLDVLEDELATLRRSPEELKKQINQEAHQSPEEDRLKEPQKIRELQALAQNKALIERANVIFTPHVAFNSVEALRRINVTTSMNIQTFVNGSPSNLIQH